MNKLLLYFECPQEYLQQLRDISQDYEIVACKEESGLRRYLPDTEIFVTFVAKLDAEMLDQASTLKWIQALSAGIEHLPLNEIRDRGILLTNGRGIHRIHMTEYALAAMITLAHNYHLMHRNQLKHHWDRSISQGEIFGAVLGILGLGSIGRELARKASFLGMRVIGVKRDPQPVDSVERVYGPTEMQEVFKQSDYIINLLPGTDQTREIIDKRYFNLMKETACFINIGRGSTVNQADLINALQNKKIRGLVSDVFEKEPLPENNPLWEMDNVIVTPHLAGDSIKYMEKAMKIFRHNLNAYVNKSGEMINVVDLDRGY